mgnify:FL=1
MIYNEHYDQVPKAEVIREMLEKDPSITHVAMVHSETTSGILNNIEAVGKVVKSMGKVFYCGRYEQLCRSGYSGKGLGNRLYHQQCK